MLFICLNNTEGMFTNIKEVFFFLDFINFLQHTASNLQDLTNFKHYY